MSKSTTVLSIDPGTTKSAYVVWDGETLFESGILPNEDLAQLLMRQNWTHNLAIERISNMGMAVGQEVFDTCFWTGDFRRIHKIVTSKDAVLIPRVQVKMHICNSPRAKDPNIRQALVDRYGKPGTKKEKGRLYGVSSHIWAALAVAVYAVDNIEIFNQPQDEGQRLTVGN